MRAAIHLHLFYPDIALELIDRVARLGRADIDVIATYVETLDPAVDRALDRVPGRVIRQAVPNRGWDIGPLLHIVPRLVAEGYDAVCHLHTKKGDSGFADDWRGMAYDGLIADAGLVSRILAAFAGDPALMILGPAPLYKSAAAHQFRNAEILSALAPRLLAPSYPLADWGFFAGTFFWARPRLLERMLRIADFGEHEHERDGTLAHALERLFGLAPVADAGKIGLVEDGAITMVPVPGEPSHEPMMETLALYRRHEAAAGELDPALADLIARHNPLVDYIRHPRDGAGIDPNPYFSTRWYNRVHSDVAAAGMHPLHHYAHYGWAEGRSTGPMFDGRFYLAQNPEVTGDPLRHFLEHGLAEGRSGTAPREAILAAEERPRRFYTRFDGAAEAAFLHRMATLPAEVIERAAAMRVSVIMPAYNREATIAAAIRSVLAQTHANLELIVVDDGSTDPTAEMVEPFLADGRVRLIAGEHRGVSAARNLGLAHATGEWIAYLDSDNRWNGWFLEVMTRFLAAGGMDAGYSAISLRDEGGNLIGYRGDAFDWEACLEQNYVDLNTFCHRRELIETVGAFDEKLRRMVDWDLILRIGKGRAIGYAPFVGCDYADGKAGLERVTTVEPAAFQRLVWTKNRHGLEIGSPAFAAQLKLVFAIKIAAPEEEKDAWGDWHFAESLAEAIRRLGHEVHIDCRGQWHRRSLAQEDVAIVLRGLIGYEPRPGQLALMWNISHPDQVGYDEYDRFTRVYVASLSYAGLLRHLIRPPVTPLLQATDAARFRPVDGRPGDELLFCGNSRGVERDIVRWANEAGLPLALYGGGWEGRVPPGLLKGEHIDNRELGARYAAAGAVLNDHWPSMAAFGLLSNRLFDIVAAGGKAISDSVPSIPIVFGDAVEQAGSAAELREAVERWEDRPRPIEQAAEVHAQHSFDARAATIVGDVLALLGLERPADRSLPAAARAPLRVHAIVPHGPHGPQSSAFIRLVAPLTDETVVGRIDLSLGRPEAPAPSCDLCIVQRAALTTVDAVGALTADLARRGTRLVMDLDDAFVAIPPEHPEAAIYRPINAAIEQVIAAADESWYSTAALAEAYAHVGGRHAVMPNAIDPRIWRDWRQPRPEPFQRDRVRMLYMGTATHGPDFALIRPALERLAAERPGQFDVVLVGVAPDVTPATWLSRLSPPADAIAYARFVRWLRAQGPFDIGLAPLADSAFNRAKSDVKLLDYAALGLLPVVQDSPAYRADPALAQIAILAGDWHEALASVLDDRESGRQRAVAAHAHVWAHRTVGSIAQAMVDRLEAVMC